MLEKLYILYWRSDTGYEGHGQPISYEKCIALITSLNEKYPTIHHWCTPAEN